MKLSSLLVLAAVLVISPTLFADPPVKEIPVPSNQTPVTPNPYTTPNTSPVLPMTELNTIQGHWQYVTPTGVTYYYHQNGCFQPQFCPPGRGIISTIGAIAVAPAAWGAAFQFDGGLFRGRLLDGRCCDGCACGRRPILLGRWRR